MATIPFENSNFKSETEIFLSDNTSKFVMNEILFCGRINIEEIGCFESFSHLGNMIIFNYNIIF